ncbi:ribosome-inactivating family protein [Streptomyces bauhiniae]|uniref:rRNA N-glycosylase n=1 Tax=Streptomyces bauhiniae TaxID=2340725 RepID=A0A7K3QRF3_9ACTN|nr:ribosome-inactivating family protein [Streptomyces bauhiniae]NEB92484.1 hypothetical protein [Streptomyces bauhiniae]
MRSNPRSPMRAVLTVATALLICFGSVLGTGTERAQADTGTGNVSHIYMDLPDTPSNSLLNSYRLFINSLREAAGHIYRQSVHINQSYEGGLIRADLNINQASRISLWITPQDLYVQGFTNASGETLYFNDVPQNTVNQLLQAAAAQGFNGAATRLPYGGNYNSLRQAAGRGREAMRISHWDIYSSVANLATTRVGLLWGDAVTYSARSLSLMIQFASEASRFNDVYGVMSASLASSSYTRDHLPLQQQYLENSWAAMSRFGIDITNNGAASPITVVGAGTPDSSGDPTNLRLTTWSDVSRYLGMLLGNFNLPQEGPSGDWGHTEL